MSNMNVHDIIILFLKMMSDDLFDPSDFYMFPPVFFQFSRFTKQRTTNTQQPNSDFLMDLFYFVLKYGRF